MIAVLWCSTQTVFTVVSHVVPGYESSMMIISAHIRIGHIFLVVRYCVTVAFLTPFFCVQNIGDTLSAR